MRRRPLCREWLRLHRSALRDPRVRWRRSHVPTRLPWNLRTEIGSSLYPVRRENVRAAILFVASMTSPRIPFTRVHLTGRELEYIREVMESNHFAGDGPFTRKCEQWLEHATGAARVLLTHSGTAALDMAAILSGVGKGDEVIMPSFTFSSTANAF